MRRIFGEMVTKKLSVFGTKRDLTFRRPKWSFKMVFTDPSDIPIISVRSLTVNRRFLSTNSFTLLTCWSSVDVDGALQVINTFSTLFEVFVPLINIFLRHGRITKGLPQHPQRFRSRNFIPQTKFDDTSLLN